MKKVLPLTSGTTFQYLGTIQRLTLYSQALCSSDILGVIDSIDILKNWLSTISFTCLGQKYNRKCCMLDSNFSYHKMIFHPTLSTLYPDTSTFQKLPYINVSLSERDDPFPGPCPYRSRQEGERFIVLNDIQSAATRATGVTIFQPQVGGSKSRSYRGRFV